MLGGRGRWAFAAEGGCDFGNVDDLHDGGHEDDASEDGVCDARRDDDAGNNPGQNDDKCGD